MLQEILPGIAAKRELKGALLGGPLAQLYSELTLGSRLTVVRANSNLIVEGQLRIPAFRSPDRRVVATVAGDFAAIAVIEKKAGDGFVLDSRGLLYQPDALIAVQSAYFDKDGKLLSDEMVSAGDLDSTAHVIGITNFRGRSRISEQYDIYDEVSKRARQLIGEEMEDSWIFNVE